MSARMTEEMRAFLIALEPLTKPATRKDIGVVTTKAEAKGRQDCRRQGLAIYTYRPGLSTGWEITPAGRTALDQTRTEGERDGW